MITIRAAKEEDHPSILALGQNFILTPYMIDPIFRMFTSVTIPLLIVSQLKNKKIITLVAEYRDTVIGFISYAIEEELSFYLTKNKKTKSLCASILFLTVSTEHRNKNIGSLLLDSCLEECKKKNIDIMRVGTDYGNHAALHLYQKKGFVTILSWHIYRIYKQQNTLSPVYKIPTMINPIYPDSFMKLQIKNRPVPWLYEPSIDTNAVIEFLNMKTKKSWESQKLQLIEGNIDALHKVGFTIQQDFKRAEHYQLPGTLWTINDLFETNHYGTYLPSLLQQTISKLPNFLMAECWVCAHDYHSQTILTNIGMRFVYGGISLRLGL